MDILTATSFEGVVLTPKQIFNNPHGDVLRVIRSSDSHFNKFGEAYFSFINFGAVKGWKLHKSMTLNLVVPLGSVFFVLAIKDPDSGFKFRTFNLSIQCHSVLTIPPGIWVAFKGLEQQNLLLNVASEVHSSNEYLVTNLTDIPFDFSMES